MQADKTQGNIYEEESLKHQTQKECKATYQDKQVGILKIDLVVEDRVIVEVKALTGNMP